MKHLKLFFALFAMLALGVGNAWAETVTMTAGTNGSTCTVNGIDGIKVGTSSKGGDMTITVPAGATSLQLYAAAWKGVSGLSINITPTTNVSPTSISLTADNGITSNSPFTLSGNAESFKHEIALSNITSATTLTLASSTTKRFVVWGATCTIAGGEDPGTGGETPEPEPDPTPDPGTGGEALSFTWDLSTKTYTTGTNEVTWTTDGLATMHNSGTNATNYLGGDANNRSSSRFYTGNTLSITPAAHVTITSVEFTATSSNYANVLNNSTWTNASASVSGTTVTVTPTNGASAISATIGGTCGFTGVTVHYTKAASGEPDPVIVKTLKSIAVAGMKTTYEQGDIFKFNGTCTATYSVTKDGDAQADETAEVTPTSVSTPNMNTIGTQTVTVTYSEGGVEKTAEYQITITENTVTAGEYCITPNNEFWGTNFNGTISGDALNQVYTGRQDDITVQYSKGSGSNLYINNTQTRTYNGTALTIFAPNGYVITAIAFTADGSNWAGTHTANVGTMTDSKNWAGSANEVTITFGGTCRVTKICVTYEAAPVEPVKTLTSIEITIPATQTTFWQGETFNHKDLVVTAHYSDAADEVITPTVTGSTATAGTATVNVSYKEQSTSYTITIKAIPNTKETAYTVADAFDIIDKLGETEGIYITGTISQVDSYSSTYKSITYWISADGTTTNQLQVYGGKGLDNADFASELDLTVGDQVIVVGKLKKYNSTYEFDANNYLASHIPTTKDPADIAYATTEYTANVGEDFTEPTLTNPNSLTVTYSSSNTALATVDATTGEVSILAAGKVTITASSAADATYAAGSASYNITITDPSLAVATLPFYFDGKKADIEGTAGMTQEGIDSDYNAAPYLKFNTAGDWAIVQFDSEPGEFSFLLKQNGQNAGTFTVYESANGEDYTPIWSGGDLGGNGQSATIEPTLSATARYVKFEYTTKGASTNYGLGSISIQKADHRAEAGIAWNPATVSLTVGDAFTAPTFNNPNGLSGITFASDNETLATVDNAGAITLVSGKTGTATITATFADGHAYYKPAEATCVITVSPKSEKVVILAQYNGQWYALKAGKVDNKTVAALEVTYFEGKLYNVDDADKALIEWDRAVVDGNATFKNGENYLSAVNSADLTLSTNACDWVCEDGIYKIESSDRTFLYRAAANGFKNYDKDNADTDDYSSLPVVTAPVYTTGDVTYTRATTAGKFGTICLPFGSTNYTGAEFFEFVGSETGKVYIGSVDELVAGVPYIFLASAAKVVVTSDGTTAANPDDSNGLYGTFTDNTEVAVGNYILKDNALCQAEAICYVNAYRAYIVMSEVPTGVPQQMPGRRYIGMSTKGENAETGLENIIVPEGQAVKVISNGQLIIIRDGEMYNAQGQKL